MADPPRPEPPDPSSPGCSGTVRCALLRQLEGGDLRSKGRADEVAREVISDPSLLAQLLSGLDSESPVVRMRSFDALEKVSRALPRALQSERSRLLRLLGEPQPKEVLWHLLQMIPRVGWRREQLPRVFNAVGRALSESSSIVRTCAMQALVDLIPQRPEQEPLVIQCVQKQLRSGTPAMRSRARKLLISLKESQ